LSALLSRSGVIQEYYSTIYCRVIDNLPIHPNLTEHKNAGLFKKIYGDIYELSDKTQNGDKILSKEIESMFDTKCRPFGLLNGSDLSGYVSPLKTESSEINKSGDLICKENLGVIKGDPDVLQFILSYSQLKEMGELSKNHLEKFLIPENRNILLKALEKMESWFDEKPGLLDKLEEKEEELDEIIFDNTKSLTKKDIIYIKRRIKSHPLDKIIVTTPPGVATKRIPHKRWLSGERYKE